MLDRDTTAKADSKKAADDGIHRLEDMRTREVSIVPRGANKKRWLFRKEDSMPGQEVFDDPNGTMTTDGDGREPTTKALAIPKAVKADAVKMITLAKGRMAALVKAVEAASESGSGTLPAPVVREAKAIAAILRNLNKKHPSKAAKTAKALIEEIRQGIAKADDKDPRKVARSILWRAMREVDQGAFDPPEEKAAVNAIIAALKPAVSKTSKAADKDEDDADKADGEDDEKAHEKRAKAMKALVLPEGMKADLVKALTAAMKALDDMWKLVDGATEGEGEGMPNGPAVTMNRIADMLEGAVGEKADDMDDDDDADKSKAAKADVNKKVEEVFKILSIALAKMETGKPLDQAAYDAVDKAKGLLDSLRVKADQADDDDPEAAKARKGDDGGDRAEAAKGGAKLSRQRRKDLKAAISTLSRLLDEVSPAEPKADPPHGTRKADEGQQALETVQKALADEQAAKADLAAQVRALTAKVADLQQAVRPGNVQNTDVGTEPRVPANKSADSGIWSRDMNDLRDK